MKHVKKTKMRSKRKSGKPKIIKKEDEELISLLTMDDNKSNDSSCEGFKLYEKLEDPVRQFGRKKKWKQEERRSSIAIDTIPDILPTMSVRLIMGRHCEPYVYPPLKYKQPPMKGSLEAKKKRDQILEKGRKHFCHFEVVKVPSPMTTLDFPQQVGIQSPQISSAKVLPQRASVVKGAVYPDPQTASVLELHKPKSGVFINVTTDKPQLPTEKVLRIVRPKRISYHREERLSTLFEGEEGYDEDMFMSMEGEEEVDIAADEYLKTLRRKVSQTSAVTSYNSKDIRLEEEASWEGLAVIGKLVQTFREEQEIGRKTKPKKRYKRGTLQSHSFTKLHQKTMPEVCYKLVTGSINQADTNYTEASRNKQGICMPIAAYCYSHIKPPKYWSDSTIDEVLDCGNRLYLDSVSSLHMHVDEHDLRPGDLHRYVYIGDKKVRFVMDDPDIVGHIRSTDRRVFNLTKGLTLFLQRFEAGILQASNLNVIIWKSGKKYLYFFDAAPRAPDLCQERTGTAVLAKFCKVRAIVTVLLDRTDLGNSPFTISPISVIKVLGRHEKDEDVVVQERSHYNILNENKAVVQASFDLGDKCFEFSRNKQAVPMAVMAIIYSYITPAGSWKRRTVDKIMIIGNQLYLECAEAENHVEINLEDIPSGFSIGPYAVEIFIFANLYAELMYKKGVCEFEKCLTEFFEKNNSNAIVQIAKHTLAVWQQRNMFFLFDPYTRNNEALKSRAGSGCVSMHSNVESVIETITANYDNKDLIFYIHALKILKIHRDAELANMFPKGLTMSNIPAEVLKKTRIRRCKKKAIEKPIRIEPTQYALKKIAAGETAGESIYEIDSTVASIQAGIFPPLPLKLPPKSALVADGVEKELVAALDSASLSDTQIEPDRPRPSTGEEEIMMVEFDNFDTTMDELEMCGEDEDYEAGGDMQAIAYMRSTFSQVRSVSLDSYHRTHSAVVNTDLTYNYKILPAIELPIKHRPSQEQLPKYYISPSQELEKDSNYVPYDETTQILCGSENILKYTMDLERVAPFICILAIALHEEVPISKWRSRTIDFILKTGKELYDQHEEIYSRIEDLTLQFPENEYKIVLEILMDTYVGNDLFTNSIGVKIIKDALETSVFKKYNSTIIITPHYVCGILLFNSLYYLFDCYGGEECQCENFGFAFVARFKAIEDLIVKLMETKNRRDGEVALEYVRLVICVPIITVQSDQSEEVEKLKRTYNESKISTSTTQSQELSKPNNFLELPDGSQILRGTTNLAYYDENVEFLAPFACIMATCVSEKYSVITWCKEIVDYVLQCGAELYQHSSVRFDQVSKIDIPRISLGSTDYSVEVDYLHDAIFKEANLEKALHKHLAVDYEWALIVTRYYSCAVCVKNHVFYMYDPFGNNLTGFGEGLDNTGVATLQRFKNLHSMVMRILANKAKREFEEVVQHTKFVLSSCKVLFIPPEVETKSRDGQGNLKLSDFDQAEEAFEEGEEAVEAKEEKAEKRTKKVNKVGYQPKGRFEVIEANSVLPDRESTIGELKDDHFVCVMALLNVITTSMQRWDTKRVDAVVEQGKSIYKLADDLNEANKRVIKNVIVDSHFFDIIVKKIKIEDFKKNKTLEVGLDTVLRRRRFCIVQFQNCSYAVYRDEEGVYHLFDPYGLLCKEDQNAEEEEDEEGEDDEDKTPKSCWIKFGNDKSLKKYMRDNLVEGLESYTFYMFVVMSVKPAPKDVILSHKLNMFEIEKRRKGEIIGKPFYEQQCWLKAYQVPWSFDNHSTACGKPRHKRSSRWYNWDIEYVNDLFSLCGTIHQIDRCFDAEFRGKQTISNMVIAIAMTYIYQLEKWNQMVLDSILQNGNAYFKECIEGIEEENYELQMSDLKENAKIFPYTFNVQCKPVVEGTMFLVNDKKFNLYKALRYFFDHYESRCGVICSINGEVKKWLAFGKFKDSEYFVYDCQTHGMPVFLENRGVSYVLRCLTLNRLLYCLACTLKGGDFYIFEIEAYNFQTINE